MKKYRLDNIKKNILQLQTETYNLSSDTSQVVFTFFSIGRKGIITKVVVYEHINENNFNLAFGDYNSVTQTIDDLSVSNNGDLSKVLATVIKTMDMFFIKHPNATIFLKGSTSTRTKLYQRIITNNAKEVEKKYKIMGIELENETNYLPIDFLKNYVQFCIKRI